MNILESTIVAVAKSDTSGKFERFRANGMLEVSERKFVKAPFVFVELWGYQNHIVTGEELNDACMIEGELPIPVDERVKFTRMKHKYFADFARIVTMLPHRVDGPAVIHYDESGVIQETYCLDGVELDFIQIIMLKSFREKHGEAKTWNEETKKLFEITMNVTI